MFIFFRVCSSILGIHSHTHCSSLYFASANKKEELCVPCGGDFLRHLSHSVIFLRLWVLFWLHLLPW